MKRILSVLLAAFLLASVLPFAVGAEEAEGSGALVINENGDYVLDQNDYTAVDIDGVTGVITLSEAGVFSTGRSAIKVMNNSDVTFVLEGYNTVEGDADAYSCGIEVEYGSKVTFEGEGALNVTGGLWGAAIGSYGTDINIPAEERVKVGEITVNSGNINAYAGRRGAGIGSGYHVDANLITINGGVIHAYGNECGAGIGTGYGTSGGAIGVAAVGDYSAGRIVINGGEVYAGTKWNASFDYSDLSALNADDPGSFAAGIGGGYGSSAPDIEINGGKVVAIGSCGGAGIGAGRGCSNANKYNRDTYTVNVKIGGNADVTAITADCRGNEINSGGAAIGSGRGSHTGGTVEITGSARVVAISATQAPAIGASKQKSPVDGATPVAESIVIGDNVDLYAASAGAYAVDKDAASLSVNDEYFGSSDRWFFGEEAKPIEDVANVKVESTKGEMMYTAPTGTVSVWARIKPESDDQGETVKTGSLEIVAPLAMALRFEDGSVYYSGDTAEVEIGREYRFQMCSVDWSTRSANGEKKIHKPYETFYPSETAWQHTDHGIYSDDEFGLCGTVVYSFTLADANGGNSYDPASKSFTLYKGNYTLRTDNNNCFMAYRFYFRGSQYNKQTGIDKVVYDSGVEHENTLEDFRYTKPLESLSVNLPLGSTVTAKAYKNYEYVTSADVFISIDEENPDLCYKDYYWDFE